MGPRKLWFCLLLALLAAPGWGQSDEEKTRQELQTLQRDISRISSEISSARSRRNKLQEQLRKAEVALGELQKQVSQNQREIDQTYNRLKTLQQQRAELEQARDLQQARVGTELRTAWQQGNQGQIKVLLNQESPHTVARSLAYYRYFFDARNKLIEQYRGTLEELLEVQTEINKTALQLEEDNQALAKKQEQTRIAQSTREQAVASLSSSIDDKSGQLKALEEDRRELEDLLVAIEEAVINLKVPENYQAFAEAKGKMPWPVAGKPSNRYGHTRNQGDMRWQGINIPAKSGSTVKAIHHGRVVYADWLRGSGLLLIIDHGDGFMSLYAHNQSLLREVGEWVTAETAISTVGNSGGLTRPTLYFEIRHKGKPTDPARWCKG